MEIVHRGTFRVVGIKYRGKNAKGEIPKLWEERFFPRLGEIRQVVEAGVFYGVEGNYDPATGNFDYLAGLEVDADAPVPHGMADWVVAEADYAVFPTTLPEIRQTMDYIHREWLPQSGYRHTGGPEFEYYGTDFMDGERMSVYVPVVRG